MSSIGLLLGLNLLWVRSDESVSSNCNDLEDGTHLLKLIDDDSYPLVNAQCSNGYTIVDYNMDSDWESYLSSFREFHYAVAGPTKDDHVNWDEWFLPDTASYIVSPDCSACDDDSDMQLESTMSAYYMTDVGRGCVHKNLGTAACDLLWDSYTCQKCTMDMADGLIESVPVYNGLNSMEDDDTMITQSDFNGDYTDMGLCPFAVDSAQRQVLGADEITSCTSLIVNLGSRTMWAPSLGLDGRFCMCVKPSQDTMQFGVSEEDVATKMASLDAEDSDSDEDSAAEDNYYLYQTDFDDGTYRITKSGTYVLMENIVFDFKTNSDLRSMASDMEPVVSKYSRNSELWAPTESDADRYEGAGALRGPYFMGFYAGIAIETSDVTLDLNGFSVKQSQAFYYQQQFFACIALISQAFLPWQGFGAFGNDPSFASNVVIKNGLVGLSSHHGIQGHYNNDVLIENVHITDFKTHGIQLNGFDGVTIRNVEIGPNQFVDKLTPHYAHMRHLLPMYSKMADESEDICIELSNRDECVIMAQLVAEAGVALDMALEYAVLGKDWNSIDNVEDNLLAIWNANSAAFVSESGHPETATLYGLFLNYPGTNVIQWYTNNVHSSDVTIDTVYVHDLYHETEENIALLHPDQQALVLTTMNAPVPVSYVFGMDTFTDYQTVRTEMATYEAQYTSDELESNDDYQSLSTDAIDMMQYVGNIVTDIQIVGYDLVATYGLSWDYVFGVTTDFIYLADFAIRGETDLVSGDLGWVGCLGSMDYMIHPGKGILAVRLNGIDGVVIDGLTISNVKSTTDLGDSICGDQYLNGKVVDGLFQQGPYMTGFTMNRATGLSITYSALDSVDNVVIDNVESETGRAYGIEVWYSSDYLSAFGDNVQISNIKAGTQVEEGTLTTTDRPNFAPVACAAFVHDTVSSVDSSDYGSDWDISSIEGEYGCTFSDVYTNMGSVTDDDSRLYLFAAAAALFVAIAVLFWFYFRRESEYKSIGLPNNELETAKLLPTNYGGIGRV